MLTQDDTAPVTPASPRATAGVVPTRLPLARWALTAAERFGLVLALLFAVVLFSAITPESFPTTDNVRSVLSTNSVLAMLAIATVIPLVAGEFDLSLAATLGLTSLVSGSLMSDSGVALVPALVAAVALGATVGLINGVVVARIGVSSIVTTLGTASVLSGVVLWISGGQSVATGLSPTLIEFGTTTWLGIPAVFYAVVAAALVAGYLLRQTPFGRSLYAIGDNDRAAVLVGLPVIRMRIVAFVLGGALAGIAGVVQIASAGSANPQVGPNLLLPALSAVFLGATTIRPGEYNVLGTLVAVALVATSISGLVLAGVAEWVEPVYIGMMLVLAVAISTMVRRRRAGA